MAKKTAIQITPTILAEKMQEEENFFCLTDTEEWFVYEQSTGCYTNSGSNILMQKLIREKHRKLALERNKELMKIEESTKKDWGDDEEVQPEKQLVKVQYDPSSHTVNETIAILKADCCMSREELDKKNSIIHLINLKNCIIDIREKDPEKMLMYPMPEMRLIRQIPVNYNPAAKCPHIEKFLNDVVSPEDKEVIIELFGYSMIPDIRIQQAIFLYGGQGGGKGTLLKLLRAFVGHKNISSVSLQDMEKSEYATSEMYGKLVNLCGDTEGGILETHNVFKMLTGEDTIRARRVYERAFSFVPTCKFVFAGNEGQLPRTKNRDPAYYARIKPIHFPHEFRGTKSERKGLIHKLTTDEELSGLLNLALEGLRRVLKNGEYSNSKSHEEVEKEYDGHASSVSAFIGKHLKLSDKDTNKIILYNMYCAWCEYHGLMPIGDAKFGKAMKYAGYTFNRVTSYNTENKRPSFWNAVEVDSEVLDIWAAKLKEQQKIFDDEPESQKAED